jgi:hypothetical protein
VCFKLTSSALLTRKRIKTWVSLKNKNSEDKTFKRAKGRVCVCACVYE